MSITKLKQKMFAFKLKSGERECTDYNNVINSSSKLIWTRGRVAMVNIILNKKLLEIEDF